MEKPKKTRRMSEKKSTALSAYVFISPFFILFAVFGLFPMIFSFYLSFFRWDGLAPMEFTGWRNFQFIFSDPVFYSSIKNTFLIGIMGTAPQIVAALFLAFALNSQLIRFRNTFRTMVFLPYITSIVAVAIIFGVVFNNQPFGFANYFLSLFDISPIRWNAEYWPVKIAIATMVFWRWVGYNTIIFLAGMQSIPKELYEAAKIDGATVFSANTSDYDSDAEADHHVRCFHRNDRQLPAVYRTINLFRAGTKGRGNYHSCLFMERRIYL